MKAFWDRFFVYVVPAALAAITLFAVALLSSDGPRFPQAEPEYLSTQARPLLDPDRLGNDSLEFLEGQAKATTSRENFSAYANLRRLLTDAVKVLPPESCLVVSENGEEIFSTSEPIGLRPASGQKLYTAIGALLELGPEYRFVTEVRSYSRAENGILNGSLYLIGGGDPYLVSDEYLAWRQGDNDISSTRLENLAEQLTGQGIRRINGSIFGNEGRYDTERYPSSWADSYRTGNISGSLSALSVNQGYVRQGENWVASASPAQTAASVFDDLLEERSVVITSAPGITSEIPNLVLARIESQPLSQILKNILGTSDNTAAELLLKEIGYASVKNGSTGSGIQTLVDTLLEIGIYEQPPQLPPQDASGVADGNRTNCSDLIKALEYSGLYGVIGRSLPVAGESGTLRRRFLGSPAKGQLAAKTGSWPGVVSLSGFVEADSGAIMTFSYIANSSSSISQTTARDFEETIAEGMLEYLNTS